MKKEKVSHKLINAGAVLVTLVSVYLIWDKFSWDSVKVLLSNISFHEVLLIASISFVQSFLKSYRLWKLTAPDSKISSFSAVSFIHNFFALMLPFKSGEIAFPVLTKRFLNTDIVRSTKSLIFVRITDLVVVLVSGAVFLLSGGVTQFSIVFLLCALVLSIIYYIYIFSSDSKTVQLPLVLKDFLPEAVHSISLPNRQEMVETLKITSLIWFTSYMWAITLVRSLIGEATISSIISWNALFSLSGALPIQTPGMVGIFEAAAAIAFSDLPGELSVLDLGLALHAVTLLLSTSWFVLGCLILLYKHFNSKD